MDSGTRPTRELDIFGNKIVIKTDLTGREIRDIEYAMFDGVGVKKTHDPKNPDVTFNTKDSLLLKEDAQIKAVVISVNGDTDVINAVLNLPAKIYQEVIKIIKAELDPKAEPDSEKAS